LQGITSQEYTITFTKTGYGTRYYTTELNQFSDIDINFALNPSTLSEEVPFKVYQTDETTLFTNTFVELYMNDSNNWIIGKRKTNLNGDTSFSIDTQDQNYLMNIQGIETYQPVALTIKYPVNEETLKEITEDWKIDITQNLFVSYTDLNVDKIVYLLPNTSNPFDIKVQDMNGNYFARTYAQTFPGNPQTAELQPYLVPIDTGLLTTITTIDATTNARKPGITLKIYKYISGEGRTFVEQVLTDSKGEALSLLVLDAEYEFEAYNNGVFIKTYEITATSSTIYVYVESEDTFPDQNSSGYNVSYTPVSTGLIKTDSGNQTFTQTLTNLGEQEISVVSQIIQDSTILSTDSATTNNKTINFTHDVAWADINFGKITSKIIINGSIVYEKNYQVTNVFDTNYSIINGLQTGIREDFGCSTTGICMVLFIVALVISTAITLFANFKVDGVGTESVGILFLISMSFFSYLNWVPLEVVLGILLIVGAIVINQRRS